VEDYSRLQVVALELSNFDEDSAFNVDEISDRIQEMRKIMSRHRKTALDRYAYALIGKWNEFRERVIANR
jgi:hypothetical protein